MDELERYYSRSKPELEPHLQALHCRRSKGWPWPSLRHDIQLLVYSPHIFLYPIDMDNCNQANCNQARGFFSTGRTPCEQLDKQVSSGTAGSGLVFAHKDGISLSQALDFDLQITIPLTYYKPGFIVCAAAWRVQLGCLHQGPQRPAVPVRPSSERVLCSRYWITAYIDLLLHALTLLRDECAYICFLWNVVHM